MAAVYWLTVVASHGSATWFAAAVASAHRAPMVAGVPIDVTALGLEVSQPTLLVALADDCEVCRTQIPAWVTLWERSGALRSIDVFVVSRTGHVLADQIARALNTAERKVLIKSPTNTSYVGYVLTAIGMSGTPMIMLLNREQQIVAVVGPPSQPALDALERIIGEFDRPS